MVTKGFKITEWNFSYSKSKRILKSAHSGNMMTNQPKIECCWSSQRLNVITDCLRRGETWLRARGSKRIIKRERRRKAFSFSAFRTFHPSQSRSRSQAGMMIDIDTTNLPHYLNQTNSDWDFELWYQAAEPDLNHHYFVACGIWLAINLIISSPLNGTILYTFITNKFVTIDYPIYFSFS